MEAKISFAELGIEVTRRCNMCCAHCLRGEAENVDIQADYYDQLLKHTGWIDQLLFTGGEPSLAVCHIRKFRELCCQYKIPVMGFYVVTNGKEIGMDFLEEMLKWYAYCMACGGDSFMCGVALSKDDFHSSIPEQNEQLLRGLSFFRTDKFNDFKNGYLINLGRARELVSYRTREPFSRTVSVRRDGEEITIDSTVLLTAKGDMIPDCDYEYDEAEEIKIGDVLNMPSLVQRLEAEVV